MSTHAEKARTLGAAAFTRGANRVPALDGQLRDLLRALPKRPDGFSDDTIPVLAAWIDGWDAENLSAFDAHVNAPRPERSQTKAQNRAARRERKRRAGAVTAGQA